MKNFEYRSPYTYDAESVSVEHSLVCPEVSLTQQHFKDECDINNILRQFKVTNHLPEAPISPRYGDFTEVTDYHTALNAVRAAEEEFMSLPAEIRERFGNDPSSLIEFLNDDRNREEAINLKLVDPQLEQPVVPSSGTDSVGTTG